MYKEGACEFLPEIHEFTSFFEQLHPLRRCFFGNGYTPTEDVRLAQDTIHMLPHWGFNQVY